MSDLSPYQHYHMAPQSAREDIQRHGLDWQRGGGTTEQHEDPETGEMQEGGNYLFPIRDANLNKNYADEDWYGWEIEQSRGEPYDVWLVNSQGLNLKKDSIGADYSPEPISPERLKLRA